MTTEANAAASNKAKARAIEAASKIFEANTIQDSHDHDTAIVTSGGLMADIAQLILDHESQVTRLQSALEARTEECNHGIYIASKTRHAPRWRNLRELGAPIISTWIDEAGLCESGDLSDLWDRCIREASTAAVLILYCEPGDVLKGGWIELGAALACGVTVFAVGIEQFTVAKDKRITHFDDVDAAFAAAAAIRKLQEQS